MGVVTREATVNATENEIWAALIDDPNRWPEWLTPLAGLEDEVSGSAREGLEFGARIGRMGGRIRIVEAKRGERLRWQAGPSALLAMGMGMSGTLELHAAGDHATHVHLRMKSPLGPMGGRLMKMMAGLTSKDEMTKTIARIKELSEHSH